MDKLLNTTRLRKSTSKDSRSEKQIFESDRGRVLFSAPFRRLQSKAKVFSLEWNASVRSRLTHTIEVAHIGRYITQQLQDIALEKDDNEFAEKCKNIEIVVETACLLHDIGNPPFGHLGEKAIQNWFAENSEKIYKKSTSNDIDTQNSYYLDLNNFDGNPQGLRIVMTLQGYPEKKGLNLTYSQIASLIKYPQYSTDLNKKRYKKVRVFTSEKGDIDKIWKDLGITWKDRYPFVYLMEAADDIAYSLSDIEDGIEKGIITEKYVLFHLKEEFQELPKEIQETIPDYEKNSDDMIVSHFVKFRTTMINDLTKVAAQFFYDNQEKLKANNNSDIKDVFDHKKDENIYGKALFKINLFCAKKLYQSKEAEDIEIAGYIIVYGILDKFSLLLELNSDEFNKLIDGKGSNNLERRMFSKIPKSLIGHYSAASKKDPSNEWFIRSQLLVDFVSGMTDDYSLKMHKLINGIEIKFYDFL